VEVPLGRDEGVLSPCIAHLYKLLTISISAFTEKIGALSKSRQILVKRALGDAFNWDELLGL